MLLSSPICLMESYDVLREIGCGAFGVAFLIRRKSDGGELVAKRIYLDNLTLQARQRAIEEATTTGVAKHPNIVTFEDHFKDVVNGQECLFIIMEYCAGGSLRSHMNAQAGRPFTLEQVVRWLHPICQALAHMHRREIMHRDLKPENVFLTADGLVKVGDFGVAVIATITSPSAKTPIGSFAYMAPETLSDDNKVDYRCDLWSLGVILHELIMLKLPFEANNIGTLVRRICSGTLEPLPESTPQELSQLVRELLCVDPSARPQCGQIVRRDFIKHSVEAWSEKPDDKAEANENRLFRRKSKSKGLRVKISISEEEVIHKLEKKLHDEKKAGKLRDFSLLHYACMTGETKIVEALLQKGDDVNDKKEDGWSPLHVSCRYGHSETVTFLLQQGALVNAKDKDGSTPLHLASGWGHVDVVSLLLQRGAAVDATCKWLDIEGWTPLHLTSRHGHPDVVALLIQHGAEINAQDEDGWTPLHWASLMVGPSKEGCADVVHFLLRHNADKSIKNNIGGTAYDVADKEIKDLLL